MVIVAIRNSGDLTMRLIRYGECVRCGDCCRTEEFKIPLLWRNGKCIYLKGNDCTVWDTDKRPKICKDFPMGGENVILEKLALGKRLDFKPLLPNCTFWFEVVDE